MFQIPNLTKTNTTYVDYANKTYETLFSDELRQNAIPYAATHMETSVMWNKEDSLILEALPLEAQISPVFAIVAEDLDQDGHKDLWLGGNFYGLKPEVGYNNASRGVFLKGSSGNFQYIPSLETGIEVSGEVRDAAVFKGPEGIRILVARNNMNALIFESKNR